MVTSVPLRKFPIESSVLSTCLRVLLFWTSSMAPFTSIRASPNSWQGQSAVSFSFPILSFPHTSSVCWKWKLNLHKLSLAFNSGMVVRVYRNSSAGPRGVSGLEALASVIWARSSSVGMSLVSSFSTISLEK